jgi:lysozyme
MLFNMNSQKLLQFRKMWTAIEAEDFERAAAEMLDSRWAEQVGQRAVDLAEIMRAGE